MKSAHPTQLDGKKIVVLGYGINNRGLVGYLLNQNYTITIRDANPLKEAEFRAEYSDISDRATFEVMPDILKKLEEFEIIFRTPAIPSDKRELLAAAKRGTVVTSQTGLFLELCPARVIGITGTKGKGTTASLLARMLEAGYAEGKTYLTGNIGNDPFDFLSDITEKDLVVLELSSYQLEDVKQSPEIAVVLHVTLDHLDHHKDLAAYRAAKVNILAYQSKNDIAVINGEYPEMDYYASQAKGKLLRYYRHHAGQQAAWCDHQGGKEVIFYQVDDILDSFEISHRKLLGEHNLENILPAVLVAALFHVPSNEMAKVVTEFGGLPHRLSFVKNDAGILAYDDSIATTSESCMVALEAMPAGVPIHLLAGGNDKGHVYGALAEAILARCTTVTLLPGTATPKLEKALGKQKHQVKILHANGETPLACMEAALKGILPYLNQGDIILLAPAELSGLPFLEYKARGDAFVEAIQHLKKEQV